MEERVCKKEKVGEVGDLRENGRKSMQEEESRRNNIRRT